MGKSISVLGFDWVKTQLLIHYYLYYNGLLSERQAKFNCPHCGVSSIINGSNISFNHFYNRDDHRFFLSCIIGCINSECRKETVITEQFEITDTECTSLPELIKRDRFIDLIDQNTIDIQVVYPSGNYVKMIDYGIDADLIPTYILSDFKEIQFVASISPRATLILSRRFLEKILLDKYPVLKTERNLEKMIEKVPDSSLSKDTMDDMRIIGNKAIHVADPKDKTELTNDDSSLAIHVIDDLLREFYIIPGNKRDRKKRLSELRERVKGEACIIDD